MSEINLDEMQTVLMMQFDQLAREQEQIEQDIEKKREQEQRQAKQKFDSESDQISSRFDSIDRVVNDAREKLSVHFNMSYAVA